MSHKSVAFFYDFPYNYNVVSITGKITFINVKGRDNLMKKYFLSTSTLLTLTLLLNPTTFAGGGLSKPLTPPSTKKIDISKLNPDDYCDDPDLRNKIIREKNFQEMLSKMKEEEKKLRGMQQEEEKKLREIQQKEEKRRKALDDLRIATGLSTRAEEIGIKKEPLRLQERIENIQLILGLTEKYVRL